jgi:diguanylate cyclase (GGDEF)-like protein
LSVATKGNETTTAIKTMLAIVGVVFIAELAVMTLLAAFEQARYSGGHVMLLDALVLSLLVAPPVYWLILVPVRREYEKRLRAESLAEDMGRLAITDSLTRIMNRRGITVALLDSMAQSERYHTPLTVAMADIDHFKRINDTHGHEAGDKVLVEIANALSEELRMPDKVGRYGGEEFLILLPHTTLVQGRKIADRIRATLSRLRIALDGEKVSLTLSFGLVQFRDGEDLEQMLSRVDRALYEAKQTGRNRVVAQKPPAPARSAARSR